MKLIGSLTSPYTRKVRIVLAEKNIAAEFSVDLPWSPQTVTPQFNPLGKVPVLVLDDGRSVYDSRVIVEYLDLIQPEPPLFPGSGDDRIQIKRWEALADGMNDAAAAVVIERRRVESERSAVWIERQLGKVDAGFAALSAELGDKPFCHGESLSLADITVATALGFVSFRLPEVEWAKRHSNLAALYERLNARPTFAESVPRE